MISLEEFKRIDLRVGEIVAVDPMPGSDRLLRLTVDLGVERRTLVGGLAKSYRADELFGLRVVVAANIAPARIRGVLSEGMLLGAGCEEGASVSLLTVNRPVNNGSRVL